MKPRLLIDSWEEKISNMARMIPPYISPDVKSAAERKIYALIKDSKGTDDLVCLHSLGLSRHMSKRQGEIDFVLVCDGAILCLEVKGGRINRKDGVWYFTDRYGQETKKSEGPFVQASSAMFSLKKDLDAQFGNTGLLFGYGVVVPDINFDVESPEWDAEIVYDLADSKRPFEAYIKRLRAYWEGKVGRPNPRVSTHDIVKYLRGNFELATPLWKQIQDVEDEMTKFTSEQYRALDQMESNPRLIFSGGAGTGKTMLAVEKARRAAFNGQHVLLLCYNKLLGAKLRSEIAKMDGGGTLVQADSIHKYFLQVISAAGMRPALSKKAPSVSGSEMYDEVFSQIFIEAQEKMGAEKFDLLVIDEGQDLLNEDYLLALDTVLQGGFKGGSWMIFLDPGAQARLFNKFSLETYHDLKSLGASEYKLDMNCRNTAQIATQAAIVSGFPTGIAKIEGPEVIYQTYAEEAEQARQVIELIGQLMSEERIPAERITIVSTRKRDSMSLLTSGAKLPAYFEELTDQNVNNPEPGKVYYVSAQSYKGLENNVIVYTDVDKIDDEWIESVNYVGMTRARQKLYVFMHKKLARTYGQRMLEYAKQQHKS